MFCTNCGRPLAADDVPCAHCNGIKPVSENIAALQETAGLPAGAPTAWSPAAVANANPIGQSSYNPVRSGVDKAMFTLTVLGVMGARPLLSLVGTFYLFVLLGYICDGIIFVVKWLFGKGR